MKKSKLLTKELLKKLPPLYATEKVPAHEKVAVVKFFGGGRGTWYGVEFDGEDRFFGYVVSPLGEDCDEWGYFSLSELESVRFPVRMLVGGDARVVAHNPIERDLYWKPGPIPEVVAKAREDGELDEEPTAVEQEPEADTCVVLGCDGEVARGGFCDKHGQAPARVELKAVQQDPTPSAFGPVGSLKVVLNGDDTWAVIHATTEEWIAGFKRRDHAIEFCVAYSGSIE